MSKVMKKSATAYGMNGRVGNIVYYQNGGDTNAMVYDDAPRKNKSINQVTNQCKWTNIVQLWRSSSEFLCRCFQHKKGKQSDFNMFMKQGSQGQVSVTHLKVYPEHSRRDGSQKPVPATL